MNQFTGSPEVIIALIAATVVVIGGVIGYLTNIFYAYRKSQSEIKQLQFAFVVELKKIRAIYKRYRDDCEGERFSLVVPRKRVVEIYDHHINRLSTINFERIHEIIRVHFVIRRNHFKIVRLGSPLADHPDHFTINEIHANDIIEICEVIESEIDNACDKIRPSGIKRIDYIVGPPTSL